MHNFFEKAKINKEQNKEHCDGCPLQDTAHYGPLFFESEGESPRIMLVTESPVGFKKIDFDASRIDEWKRDAITKAKSWSATEQTYPTSMDRFPAYLTDNAIFGSVDGKTSNNFYWTHTVKCFIQKPGENSYKESKEKRPDDLERAHRRCCKYLSEEITIIKPDLIITLGGAAFEGIIGAISNFKFYLSELQQSILRNATLKRYYDKFLQAGPIKMIGPNLGDDVFFIPLYHPSPETRNVPPQRKIPGYIKAKEEIKRIANK